jgi:hypothetical protein
LLLAKETIDDSFGKIGKPTSGIFLRPEPKESDGQSNFDID